MPIRILDLSHLFASPEMYPLKLDPGTGQVTFVRMTAQSYRDSAFLDSRITLVDNDSAALDLEQLLTYRSASKSRRPAKIHFILHTAFCCSTLLARFLEALPTTLVLKEPYLLTQTEVLRTNAIEEPGGLHVRWRDILDLSMSLLTRTFQPEQAIVVKLSDVCLSLGKDLIDWAGAAATATFVYANLATFVTQVFKDDDRRQNWIYDRVRFLSINAARFPQLRGIDILSLNTAQAAAYVWAEYLLTFQELSTQWDGTRLRAFSADEVAEQPYSVLTAVVDLAGYGADRGVIQSVVSGRVASTHAKAAGYAFDHLARRAELERLEEVFAVEIAQAIDWIRDQCPSLEPLCNTRSHF